MRHLIPALCLVSAQTHQVVLLALNGVSRENPLCEAIADETRGVTRDDIARVLAIAQPHLLIVADGKTEAELCIKFIDYIASMDLPMNRIYEFVATACLQDRTDHLRVNILKRLTQERAIAINKEIAEQEGCLPRPLPTYEPNPLGPMIAAALKIYADAKAQA